MIWQVGMNTSADGYEMWDVVTHGGDLWIYRNNDLSVIVQNGASLSDNDRAACNAAHFGDEETG